MKSRRGPRDLLLVHRVKQMQGVEPAPTARGRLDHHVIGGAQVLDRQLGAVKHLQEEGQLLPVPKRLKAAVSFGQLGGRSHKSPISSTLYLPFKGN